MTLRLYNTRTRAVEPFVPQRDGEVRIYVCGMTPSRAGAPGSRAVVSIFRRLAALSQASRVSRDVRAKRHRHRRSQHRARHGDGRRLARNRRRRTTPISKRRCEKLGVLPYDREPYATQYIAADPDDDSRVDRDGPRVRDGRRHLLSGASRFRATESSPTATSTSCESGARIEVDEQKEDPLDFALWKFAKPGEPKWPFEPYGDGRPGWHIECSAMSRELLDPEGVGFDIHGGGADLIFPHHENEIAQSEPLMPHPPMARYWVHGGLLMFDNARRCRNRSATSSRCRDLLERHDPQAIRLLFLQTSYRRSRTSPKSRWARRSPHSRGSRAAYRSTAQPASTPAAFGSARHRLRRARRTRPQRRHEHRGGPGRDARLCEQRRERARARRCGRGAFRIHVPA